jgi:hypothetical protein
VLNREDTKIRRAIRRQRELAGPKLVSTRVAPKKGKGSYKRTVKHIGREA